MIGNQMKTLVSMKEWTITMLDFQIPRVKAWLDKAFAGRNCDIEERALRLQEEVIELGQAEGITLYQSLGLVYQVYGKPVGDPVQELGGVLSTLAAYLAVTEDNPDEIFEDELSRIERPEMIEKIRRKHDEKLVVSSKAR